MKRFNTNCLLAMVTVFCLLLSGCGFTLPPQTSDSQTTEQTTSAPVETTEAYAEVPDWSLVFPRLQNAGGRDYLPDGEIEMLRFDDMEYSRPDVDALCAMLEELTGTVEQNASAEEILSGYYEAYDQYYHFYSMNTLSNIRYYADLGNEYYKTEYEFCEQAAPDVEEKLEALLIACAHSPQKAELEAQYFGEDYLDAYLDYSVYTNPDYLALAKQEKTVMEAYHKALDNPQIVFEGQERSFQELLTEYEDDMENYLLILQTYYDTYNPIIGGYYIELVNIHRQMAQVLGYESYGAYCYTETYSRDYTWEEGNRYIAQIRQELVPLYEQLEKSGLLYLLQDDPADEVFVRKALNGVINKLGGTLLEAYNYMVAYDLCDVSMREEKMDASFTTYIYEYETPYILINAQGTTGDIFTFAHEFGHFTDSYYNYQSDEDLETAETFSQGLEWLAFCNMDGILSTRALEDTRIQRLADTVSVFVSQAAYSDFEERVFALPEEELTLQTLNSTYRDVCQEYGFYNGLLDFYYSMSWIDIPHFFEAPYYMISYCVSSDTALQLYQHELEQPGSGLELYNKLLDREEGAGLQAVAEATGMENPFKEGRMQEIKEFLSEQLELDE